MEKQIILAKKKMNNGAVIPAKLEKEPHNPVDAKSNSFCSQHQWHIGNNRLCHAKIIYFFSFL